MNEEEEAAVLKSREARARRQAAKLGLRMHKSRSDADAYAPYYLLDDELNSLVSREHELLANIEDQLGISAAL